MSLYLLPFRPRYQNVFKHMVEHGYPGRVRSFVPVSFRAAFFGS